MSDVQLLTIPEAADALGLSVTRVHQYLRDGHLVGLTGADGVRRIPADLVQDGEIVKSLTSVITLLRDAKYLDAEIVDWLFREDDSFPASGGSLSWTTPIAALRANRGTEVKRRAQAAGF